MLQFVHNNRKYLLGVLAAVVIIALVIWSWQTVVNVLACVGFSALFAYLLMPLLRCLERFVKRSTALCILGVGLVAAVVLLFVVTLPQLIGEIDEFIRNIPQMIAFVEESLSGLTQRLGNSGIDLRLMEGNTILGVDIQAWLQARLYDVGNGLGAFLQRAPWLLSIPFITFYFLRDEAFFKRLIFMLTPVRQRSFLQQVAQQSHVALNRYVRGQLLLSLIVGLLSAGALTILGVRYAWLLGIIVMFCNLIPYFGPFIAAVPVAISAALGGPRMILWALIVITLIQQLEGVFLSPKIVGDAVRMHPVFVMLILLAGGQIFGVGGLLLSVPLVLVLRIVASSVYQERLRRRQLEKV
nr:AI-2E family transporter [Maliibacterium massiliense]